MTSCSSRTAILRMGSFTEQGHTSIAAAEGVPLGGDARILGLGWDVEGDWVLLSRAARFVGVAAMSASRAGTLLPRVRSAAVDASACWASLGWLCRAAPARCGSQAVGVRSGRGSVKEWPSVTGRPPSPGVDDVWDPATGQIPAPPPLGRFSHRRYVQVPRRSGQLPRGPGCLLRPSVTVPAAAPAVLTSRLCARRRSGHAASDPEVYPQPVPGHRGSAEDHWFAR
jgi:hypothetical protein